MFKPSWLWLWLKKEGCALPLMPATAWLWLNWFCVLSWFCVLNWLWNCCWDWDICHIICSILYILVLTDNSNLWLPS